MSRLILAFQNQGKDKHHPRLAVTADTFRGWADNTLEHRKGRTEQADLCIEHFYMILSLHL